MDIPTAGDWRATKTGVNRFIKSLMGLPFRAKVRRSLEMTPEDFWSYQRVALHAIYQYAREHVPFYKEHPSSYGPLPQKRPVLDALAQLPVLDKQTVKERNEDFWGPTPSALTKYHTTSGTSGTPLRISATLREKGRFQAAKEDYFRRVSGSRYPRSIRLSGFLTPTKESNRLYWRDWAANRLFTNIYALRPRNRSDVVDVVRRFQPELFYGHASAVHEFAKLVGERLPRSREKATGIVTSEVLLPHWRSTVEKNICRKVCDFYSSQENSHLITECRAGKRHINPLIGIVEIVDEQGNPVEAGQTRDVLITGLISKSMPLIRYKIGDTALYASYETGCACGLSWPTIGRVEGRSEDLVEIEDGRRIGMLGYHAVKDLEGIQECQLIQRGYHRFVCKIVQDDMKTVSQREEMEEHIHSVVERRMQERVRMEFEYPARIPREGENDKFKAVVMDFEDRDEV